MNKSDIEALVKIESASSLARAVKLSSLTLSEIASSAMIAKGFLNELKSGKKRINLVHLYTIAKALGRYPSELLPLAWQKPVKILPEELLSAIMHVKQINKDLPEIKKLSLEEEANMIIADYVRRLEE